MRVIAECIDVRTGERLSPGDTIVDPTPEQAERLIKAGCLELVQPPEDDKPKGKGKK